MGGRDKPVNEVGTSARELVDRSPRGKRAPLPHRVAHGRGIALQRLEGAPDQGVEVDGLAPGIRPSSSER